MCAALTVVGLAHGVVTSDVDALLFGAMRVYRECRVQVRTPGGAGRRRGLAGMNPPPAVRILSDPQYSAR